MPLLIKDVLLLPGMEGCQVLGGLNGLARAVTRVNVVDVPDIDKWTKGGEFLITTAFFAKDNPLEIADLVRKVNAAGASALGIKLQRFISAVPQEVIDVADELHFPLIALPTETAFSDIINTLLTAIVNQQAKRLQLSEQIHRAFTQLVIDGGDTQRIIDTLASIIKQSVVYLDLYFGGRFASNAQSLSELSELSVADALQTYAHQPVVIDKTVYGHLLLPDSPARSQIADHVRIALEHANTVLKLDIQKKISNLEIESRYRDLFLQDLLFNNIRSYEEVEKRAGFFGWVLDSGMVSVIVDIDNFKSRYLQVADKEHSESLEETRRRIFRLARRTMDKHFSQVYYTSFSDSVVFLVENKRLGPSEFMRAVQQAADRARQVVADETDFTVLVGIGSYKPSVMRLFQSYNEAREAIKLGRVIYRQNHTILYGELGVYQLLAPIYQSKAADEFLKSTLGSLLEYDQEHHSDLLGTLEKIVACDWNLKVAADQLYVHYNTVKYRFARICEILDFDPAQTEHKLRISLALRLRQMIE